MDSKFCKYCHTFKYKTDFHASKYSMDGLQARCKQCQQKLLDKRKGVDSMAREIKKCPKCGLIKYTTEFHKSKSTKDGLQTWCIECFKKTPTRLYKYWDYRSHPDNCDCKLCQDVKADMFKDIKKIFGRLLAVKDKL